MTDRINNGLLRGAFKNKLPLAFLVTMLFAMATPVGAGHADIIPDELVYVAYLGDDGSGGLLELYVELSSQTVMVDGKPRLVAFPPAVTFFWADDPLDPTTVYSDLGGLPIEAKYEGGVLTARVPVTADGLELAGYAQVTATLRPVSSAREMDPRVLHQGNLIWGGYISEQLMTANITVTLPNGVVLHGLVGEGAEVQALSVFNNPRFFVNP